MVTLSICGWVGFGNGTLTPDGSFKFASLYPPDFLFHYALASELSNFFPPRIPFAPNFPLVYHYFPDLFAALCVRLLGISVWDLMSHFLPLFYFSMLFLSIILITFELARKRWTVLLALILILLGSNFAFLASILGYVNPRFYTFLEFQFVPSFTILHTNPMIIGLTQFFAGSFALRQYQISRESSWLIVSCLLFLSTVVFKIFFALLVVGGLGVLSLVEGIKNKRLPYPLLAVLLPVVLGVLFIVNLSLVSKTSTIKLFPGYLSVVTLVNSGVFPSVGEGVHSLKTAFGNGNYLYLEVVS